MLNIPNPILQKIYETNAIVAPSGERVDLTAAGGVNWQMAEAIYNTVRKHRSRRVLEIGLASGISTLSILQALAENGDGGSLVSIDPFQSTDGRNAGVNHVEQAGFKDRHRAIEEFDYVALPKLLAAGERFDLVYIDGNHDFEYAVFDYFYADLLIPVGGLVGFNDCGWRSVHAALKQIPPRQRYEEIDVGLEPDYSARNLIGSLERRLTGRSSSDRYFRKRA